MANKHNARKKERRKKKKEQKPISNPRHRENLSTQPVRPMQSAKIKSVSHNATDRDVQRDFISKRAFAEWQKAFLDRKIIARNWLCKDNPGKFHKDIRKVFNFITV